MPLACLPRRRKHLWGWVYTPRRCYGPFYGFRADHRLFWRRRCVTYEPRKIGRAPGFMPPRPLTRAHRMRHCLVRHHGHEDLVLLAPIRCVWGRKARPLPILTIFSSSPFALPLSRRPRRDGRHPGRRAPPRLVLALRGLPHHGLPVFLPREGEPGWWRAPLPACTGPALPCSPRPHRASNTGRARARPARTSARRAPSWALTSRTTASLQAAPRAQSTPRTPAGRRRRPCCGTGAREARGCGALLFRRACSFSTRT